VDTRRAAVADVPALIHLWDELRTVGARAERAVNPVSTPDIAVRLADAVASDDVTVLLASIAGEPAGMAVCRVVQPDPLSDSRLLQVSHVIVGRQHRRRGVGHALLVAAVEIADSHHLEHVAVELYPSVREASRFYARLGFAPVTVQRVAPLAVLRRRLGGEPVVLRVDDIVRRRTRSRRPLPSQRAGRRTTEPVD
jgi:ribosomal protein S18 acetylase RimI-like enzyme